MSASCNGASRWRWGTIKHRQQHRTRPVPHKWPSEGWDTETYDGYARILANSREWFRISDFSDFLDAVSRKSFRQTYNWWWNLRFDVECAVKWEPRIARDLMGGEAVESGGKRLRYLDGRYLVVRDGKGHKVHHFDLAQYYRSSLAVATKAFLGRKPPEQKEHRASLFQRYSTSEIGDYCVWDARATRDLGELLIANLRKVGNPPTKPYSCGSIAANYVLRYTNFPRYCDVPTFINTRYTEAYRGGWVDHYYRGACKAWSYDLSSAYPHVLANLPDLRDGRWVPEIDDDYLIGVAQVEVSEGPKACGPIGLRYRLATIYPIFDQTVTVWLTAREALEYAKDYKISIKQAWSFKPKASVRYPLRELIKKLYLEKQRAKKDTVEYMLYKIIMNSIYGKTAEGIGPHADRKETGVLTLPVYAAETTAQTRIRVWREARRVRDDVIAVATDSFAVKRPAPVKCGHGLGKWEVAVDGERGVFVRPGLYVVGNGKKGTRGFPAALDLWTALRGNGREATVRVKRPVHVLEACRQGRFDDIGRFLEVLRRITLEDRKRVWLGPKERIGDLLRRLYGSYPLPSSVLLDR